MFQTDQAGNKGSLYLIFSRICLYIKFSTQGLNHQSRSMNPEREIFPVLYLKICLTGKKYRTSGNVVIRGIPQGTTRIQPYHGAVWKNQEGFCTQWSLDLGFSFDGFFLYIKKMA